MVYQRADGWVACPSTGRCGIAPVLAGSTLSAVSDADGLVTITPLDVPATAETTSIVATAGPSGYEAVTLAKVP